MIGWNISVYRQKNPIVMLPATAASHAGERLAAWQTDEYGLAWIHELVKEGNAIDLGGDGYPCLFTSRSKYLTPQIADSPPRANKVWHREDFDFVRDEWLGKTMINSEVIARCTSDEWLLIVAWDES